MLLLVIQMWSYKTTLISCYCLSQFCHSILLGSVRLFPLWVSPVLTRGPRLTEAIGRFLTHMPGGRCCCEQRSQLSCGQDTHMGYFHVAWPSSQCCSKLRNRRHHLPSTITADSHKGPARNCQDHILGWKILLWFSLQNISSQVFPILSFRFMMFCFLFTPFSSHYASYCD